MVNIYLNIQDRQILALSIPLSDIERLSLRPLKWLRFVTFAVCGVHGDLSATPNGPPVNYDSVSHIAETYHYTIQGDFHLVDSNVLHDRITSSEQTARASCFRQNVKARDGSACVFTGRRADACDAAHIVPKSKGHQYIEWVFHDRCGLYDPTPELGIGGINAVENGIFLGKEVHSLFGNGHAAFLRTPNFALDPHDIPRIEVDPMPPSRITLQHLEPDTSRQPILQADVHMAGTGISPPPSILLDFVYGMAAYKCWGSGQDIEDVMQRHFTNFYKVIPRPPTAPDSSDRDGSPEPDRAPRGHASRHDEDDPNPRQRRNHRPEMSGGMLRAMDSILMLSMLLKGKTPESMAAERLRQEEEEELRAEEASRRKVQQWMQSSMDNDFQSDAHTGPH